MIAVVETEMSIEDDDGVNIPFIQEQKVFLFSTMEKAEEFAFSWAKRNTDYPSGATDYGDDIWSFVSSEHTYHKLFYYEVEMKESETK